MTRYEWPRLTVFLGLAALALFSVHIVRFAGAWVARETAPPMSSRIKLEWHGDQPHLDTFHFHVAPGEENMRVLRFKRPSGDVQIHRFERHHTPPPPPTPVL